MADNDNGNGEPSVTGAADDGTSQKGSSADDIDPWDYFSRQVGDVLSVVLDGRRPSITNPFQELLEKIAIVGGNVISLFIYTVLLFIILLPLFQLVIEVQEYLKHPMVLLVFFGIPFVLLLKAVVLISRFLKKYSFFSLVGLYACVGWLVESFPSFVESGEMSTFVAAALWERCMGILP